MECGVFFLVADAGVSAPFLTDHAKLIDSVETFIFDCDGMCQMFLVLLYQNVYVEVRIG